MKAITTDVAALYQGGLHACAVCGKGFLRTTEKQHKCDSCRHPQPQPQPHKRRVGRPPSGQTFRGVYFQPREWELALLMAEDMTTQGIAETMGLTNGTVKVILSRIYARMAAAHPDYMRLRHASRVLRQWIVCQLCHDSAERACTNYGAGI